MKTNPIAKILFDEFSKRKLKNRRYSLRAFAKSLELEPSVVSKLIRGTRIPGSKTFKKILSHIPVSDTEIRTAQDWLTKSKYGEFNINDFKSDFGEIKLGIHHLIVLEALKIPKFRQSLEKLGTEINLNQKDIDRALKDLNSLRLMLSSSSDLPALTADAESFSLTTSEKADVEKHLEISNNIRHDFISKQSSSGSVTLTLAIPQEDLRIFQEILVKARRKLRMASHQRIAKADSIYNFTFTINRVAKR